MSADATDLERHPWNREFTWTDHQAPFAHISAEQARSFDENGYFVIEDLLDDEARARTIAEIDALEAQTDAFLQSRPDGRLSIAESGAITFSTHLVTRSNWLRELAATPDIARVCRDLIGPDVRLYWDQAVYKKPEKPRRFPWHQDNGYTFVEPQAYVTAWIALTEATVDNGCPWVVPGVHRMGTLLHRYNDPLGFECFSDHPDKVAVPVAAGSAVVFSSLTPHLTGPNTTDAVRKAYILQYAPDGAVALAGDAASGAPATRTACDDSNRQFLVVSGGEPVAASRAAVGK